MPQREVILDTNFLLLPFQFKIDIFSEIEYLLDFSHIFVISSNTINELNRLSKKKGKTAISARLALKLLDANKNKITIVKSNIPVDDWIVLRAEKTGAITCTNDGKLRKRLKSKKLKVVSLRGKSTIDFA